MKKELRCSRCGVLLCYYTGSITTGHPGYTISDLQRSKSRGMFNYLFFECPTCDKKE